MALNYKKLGQFINICDFRNSNLEYGEESLCGISVTKEFIVSHANLVGVSFDGYKIVKNGQFAYIPDTSRRGDKIAIAYNNKGKDIIVSSICSVFEITSKEELLPEYLMLWFMRPEFDRYARFMSNGSAREVFDWDTMCGVELPVPTIEEQRKIVNDYKVITDRIELLETIGSNLLKQIQTVFSNSNSNDKVNLRNFYDLRELSSGIKKYDGYKKYYATGDVDFDKIMNTYECVNYENRQSRANMQPIKDSIWFAKMQNTKKLLWFNNDNNEFDFILSTGFMGLTISTNYYYYLLAFIYSDDFEKQKDRYATGTTQIAINSDALDKIEINLPNGDICKINNTLKALFSHYKVIISELISLLNLKQVFIKKLSLGE